MGKKRPKKRILAEKKGFKHLIQDIMDLELFKIIKKKFGEIFEPF